MKSTTDKVLIEPARPPAYVSVAPHPPAVDLNSDAPEQATLDALKAWQGPHCSVEEIAREEPGPATPPIVKPRPRVKQVGKNPRYIPPRYIPPRLHRLIKARATLRPTLCTRTSAPPASGPLRKDVLGMCRALRKPLS